MVFSTAEQRHRRSEGASDLFGHPRGLAVLFATEMWERFSYYGMRALLVLYMIKYLLDGRADAVIGFGAVRATLEALFGPLAVQPLASQIYGFYTALVYLTPMVCGTLGETAGWHWGFAAAGIGMLVGLATYLRGLPRLPPDPPRRAAARAPIGRDGWRAVAVLVLLLLPTALFWATYEQQG